MEKATSVEAFNLAIQNFSFSLYKEVAKTENGNILYSPLSIHAIMFTACIGAASKTFDEMIATIHLDNNTFLMEEYRQFLNVITDQHKFIKLVNKIFFDNALNIKESFVKNPMIYFNSCVEKLDFKNESERQRQYINNWILNKTNNKIKNVFPLGSISADTGLVLANAVHFNSSWENKFTSPIDDFFYETPNNKVSVKMMNLKHNLRYYHDSVLKFAALELPYKHCAFKMMILLPDAKDGFKDLENNFSKINLHDISNKITWNRVNVKLPSFKLEKSLDLKEIFSKLGCPTMFTQEANFSNIAFESDQLFVTDFLHKAYLSVNKNGSEAVAVLGMSFKKRSAPGREDDKDFVVDHPFIFFILSKSNSIIFVGRMTKIDSPA